VAPVLHSRVGRFEVTQALGSRNSDGARQRSHDQGDVHRARVAGDVVKPAGEGLGRASLAPQSK
jgi:hypothetical protein